MQRNRRTFWMAITLAVSSGSALAQSPGAAGDWNAYGHDAAGSRYAALRGITRENVRELKVAWVYHTGETAPRYATHRTTGLEATPLLVAGTLYLDTPLGRVIALDPATGTERWSYDPEVDRDGNYGALTHRGHTPRREPRANPRGAGPRALGVTASATTFFPPVAGPMRTLIFLPILVTNAGTNITENLKNAGVSAAAAGKVDLNNTSRLASLPDNIRHPILVG